MPKQRYNIMLNPAVIARVDYHAARLDMSRSELINFILFDQLKKYGDDVADQKEDDANQVHFEEVIA